MSPRVLSAFVVCLGLFLVAPASFAAEFAWVPQEATGTHNIVGQEIILTGAGQEVTLDLEMSGWDPEQDNDPLLGSFNAGVDSSGLAALLPVSTTRRTRASEYIPNSHCSQGISFPSVALQAHHVTPRDAPGRRRPGKRSDVRRNTTRSRRCVKLPAPHSGQVVASGQPRKSYQHVGHLRHSPARRRL